MVSDSIVLWISIVLKVTFAKEDLGIHLVEHYFDIETTGLNPAHDKVITVQIQKMAGRTGELIGDMEILKEWESSEKQLLEKTMPLLTCEKPFDFIIIGKNLLFDFNFLSKRAEKYGLKAMDLRCVYDRVFLDLKHMLVMINEGNFKGYDRLLKRGKQKNENISDLYRQGRYYEISEYIKEEAGIFIEAYRKLRKEMPSMVKCL
jgi:DNA polymerase elongation subunit (family B)